MYTNTNIKLYAANLNYYTVFWIDRFVIIAGSVSESGLWHQREELKSFITTGRNDFLWVLSGAFSWDLYHHRIWAIKLHQPLISYHLSKSISSYDQFGRQLNLNDSSLLTWVSIERTYCSIFQGKTMDWHHTSSSSLEVDTVMNDYIQTCCLMYMWISSAFNSNLIVFVINVVWSVISGFILFLYDEFNDWGSWNFTECSTVRTEFHRWWHPQVSSMGSVLLAWRYIFSFTPQSEGTEIIMTQWKYWDISIIPACPRLFFVTFAKSSFDLSSNED